MLYLREVVQSDYLEINRIFNRSLKEAEVLEQKWIKKGLLANEAPFQAFMERKGGDLQYSLAMLYMLRKNHIKAYIGTQKDDSLNYEGIPDNYFFVIYKESAFRWYIADLRPQNPDDKIENPERIPILRYRKLKGKLWIFDPYDKTRGRLPILGEFFKKPKFVI